MPPTPPLAHHTTPTSGRALPAAGGVLLADGTVTDEAFTLIHSTVPPGDRTPLHRHTREDESFLVIAGHLTVTCGDEVFEVGAGEFVHLPRDVPHGHLAGATGAELAILAAPAGLEAFFDDWEAGGDAVEASHRHGIEFLT